MYFKDIKEGDKVYGLVFGKGQISSVFNGKGFYQFEVEFDNGRLIPYTEEGIPGWGKFQEQTLFYKKDIDKSEFDYTGNSQIMSHKKITKLLHVNKASLEIKTPSGIWHNVNKVDNKYIERVLYSGMLFMIREKKEI